MRNMDNKSILVMDTPENCESCACAQIAFDSELFREGELYCLMKLKSVEENMYENRPDWCPLKPVPNKKEVIEIPRIPSTLDFRRRGFQDGWNACIDEIIGGDE